jgi:hypothetical protein
MFVPPVKIEERFNAESAEAAEIHDGKREESIFSGAPVVNGSLEKIIVPLRRALQLDDHPSIGYHRTPCLADLR